MAQVLLRGPRHIDDVTNPISFLSYQHIIPSPDDGDVGHPRSGPMRPSRRQAIDDQRPTTLEEETVDGPVVLVIDDEPSFLRLMDILLTTNQYVAIPCPSAGDAATMARDHQPQIIMLDLHMPLIDHGLWLLEELRRDPRTQSIPVIVTSADSRGLEKHAAEIKSSSVAQLVKPFDLEQLLDVIRRTLEHISDQDDPQV